ncbi:MAG: undecaprenyldiphospho-muramoylpentapeptide beta-N-acetylglucosaminyltransferase [Flavobacteriaceae bacterium]
MSKPRVIISGGGTGGHIFPALAIADELKAQFPHGSILFVGSYNRMEMQRVPKAGYPIKGLWISGFDRKNMLRNSVFPLKLMWSMLQAFVTLKRFRPNAVIGTGGFASGPLLYIASLLGIPSMLQEQNAFPGVTNKALAKRVQAICLGSEAAQKYFPKDKVTITGNPVRAALHQSITKEAACTRLGYDATKFTLLVMGGSLGARKLNQLISHHLVDIQALGIQLIWQCGQLYAADYSSLGTENIYVKPFIDDMPATYAAADLVVSRAGALAISELCMLGKPTLFIPSPNVAENHQEKNAQALVDKAAAVMIRESAADNTFWPVLRELIDDRSKCQQLSNNIKKFAHPNATKEIVETFKKIVAHG